MGRLTGIDRPSASAIYDELRDSFYTYDLLGRMTSATHAASGLSSRPAWNLSFSHDALGRLVSQTDPLGTAGYAYDAAGRRTSLTYPGSGLAVGYTYDAASSLTEIRENPSGSNTLLATYAYDDRGRRTSLTRGNGTVTSYGYDAVSRLSQLVQNLNGTTNDLTLDFSHNPGSQIVSNIRSNNGYSFTGHANANVSSSVNGLNQLTAVGGASVTHDARGNLDYDGSRSFGYLTDNLLVSAYPHTLLYDPLGRLIHMDVAGGVIERYGYDGQSLIAEYDVYGAVTRRYVHGPGIDEPLVWYEGSGTSTRRYFHADERGSVIAVSDASGNLVGSTPNRYDEYGVPQGTLTGRFGYTGQMWLPDAGLYYYRARMYNPRLRFMQTDPIWPLSGMNPYPYVLNDPINFTDPLGLDVKCEKDRDVASPSNPIVCGKDEDDHGGGGGGGPQSGFGGAWAVDSSGPGFGTPDLTTTVTESLLEEQNVVVTGARIHRASQPQQRQTSPQRSPRSPITRNRRGPDEIWVEIVKYIWDRTPRARSEPIDDEYYRRIERDRREADRQWRELNRTLDEILGPMCSTCGTGLPDVRVPN